MINPIVSEARSWVGTKFKHQGRIKRTEFNYGGCDCLGLIMGLGIKTRNGESLKLYDITNYPKIISSNDLFESLNQLLKPVEIKNISIGNIILIRISGFPQHLAIVSELNPYISIIHSYAQARKVVEQYLPLEWQKNIVGVYEVKKY